jgi:hypothetical protein
METFPVTHRTEITELEGVAVAGSCGVQEKSKGESK